VAATNTAAIIKEMQYTLQAEGIVVREWEKKETSKN
jgi:hypothetical protein